MSGAYAFGGFEDPFAIEAFPLRRRDHDWHSRVFFHETSGHVNRLPSEVPSPVGVVTSKSLEGKDKLVVRDSVRRPVTAIYAVVLVFENEPRETTPTDLDVFTVTPLQDDEVVVPGIEPSQGVPHLTDVPQLALATVFI